MVVLDYASECSRSECPHPLVIADYDGDGSLIGVELLGRLADAAARGGVVPALVAAEAEARSGSVPDRDDGFPGAFPDDLASLRETLAAAFRA